MNLANTSDAQHNTQYASNELPSPFLPSPFAAPLALPQPSDLYGAKLKVTLDHVKREIGVVRESLEGVMQVRDEVESVRREMGILKKLVETQNEVLEKRIIDAVSSVIDSKLAPLFETVVQASSTLSSTIKSNEISAVARARAQNGRIEEVEALAKRRMEEVERQIGVERSRAKRELTEEIQKLEGKLGVVEKEAESRELAAIGTRLKVAELEQKMDSLTKEAKALSMRNASASESNRSTSSVNLVSTAPSTLPSLSSLPDSTSSKITKPAGEGEDKSVILPQQTAPTIPLVQTSPTRSDPSPPRRRPRRSHDTSSIAQLDEGSIPQPLDTLSSNRPSTSSAKPRSSLLYPKTGGVAGAHTGMDPPATVSNRSSLFGDERKSENIPFANQATTENRYILTKPTPQTPANAPKPLEQVDSATRRRRLIEQDQSQGTIMEIESIGRYGAEAEKSGTGGVENNDDDEGEPDTQE